jgi:hypothetical protein
MPLPVGSIRPSAALAAIAASIALPPLRMMSSAIWVASGWLVAAIACGAMTSERVAKVAPVTRSAAKAASFSAKRMGSRAAARSILTHVIITPEKVEHRRLKRSVRIHNRLQSSCVVMY